MEYWLFRLDTRRFDGNQSTIPDYPGVGYTTAPLTAAPGIFYCWTGNDEGDPESGTWEPDGSFEGA